MGLYIYEEKSDWSGPEQRVVESAYYGPFRENEILDRLNDPISDRIEAFGGEVTAVELTDEEAAQYYINPRQWWFEQLASYICPPDDSHWFACPFCSFEAGSTNYPTADRGAVLHFLLSHYT